MPETNNPKAAKPSRRRARQSDGTFKGDNPTTPDLNEAWEPVEAEAALEKTVDYSVKPKVNGTSQPTAGKYGKQPKIRPTFGNVTSTSH